MPKRVYAVVVLLCCASVASATTITNTPSQIAQMAGYWEVDSVQISALADSLHTEHTTDAISTYRDMASGDNQQVTVTVLSDNNRGAITYPYLNICRRTGNGFRSRATENI